MARKYDVRLDLKLDGAPLEWLPPAEVSFVLAVAGAALEAFARMSLEPAETVLSFRLPSGRSLTVSFVAAGTGDNRS